MRSVRDHEKTVVPSCVSSGKSFIAGCIIPWFLDTHYPARVFTIAPTERQLEINLWGEFSRVYSRSRIPLGGRPLTLDWVRQPKVWYAKGFAPKDALNAFGVHGPNDLFIFDDAQGIDPSVFDAFENAFAGGHAKALLLCNPVMTSGLVYDAITKDRGEYNVITIDAFKTPNVVAGREVVPGLITKEKVEQWVQKYGFNSNFVRSKVRGLPPLQEADTLISLEWLELARTREVAQNARPYVMGVDVARFGDDKTVIGVSMDRQYVPQQEGWEQQGADTMETSGRVIRVAKEINADEAFIDVIGVGAGVVDRVREVAEEKKMRLSVIGVNVAEKANDEDQYANLRSEMWWAARESLNPNNPAAMSLAGCSNDLIGDLSCLKYKVDSSGRIAVEKKEDTKKRLGRSPDHGDAYALAVFRRYTPQAIPSSAWSETPGQAQQRADFED